jgi:hypothetical protein
VFASESAKNEEADRKDDLVERDADGNYIIIAPDISISPTKIPEVDVWTDEDPEVEEKQGTCLGPICLSRRDERC